MRAGVGLVPEDRKRQSCVLGMACRANISLAMLERLRHLGMLDRPRETQIAQENLDRLRVKAASLDAPVSSLSGGNQQKIVLAKRLAGGGRLLIVDEPTRGVDVGAKAAIHALIDQLAQKGLAVMLISSELPEVIGLSTRVLVMRDGRLAGEPSRAQATQDAVLRLMAGVAEPFFSAWHKWVNETPFSAPPLTGSAMTKATARLLALLTALLMLSGAAEALTADELAVFLGVSSWHTAVDLPPDSYTLVVFEFADGKINDTALLTVNPLPKDPSNSFTVIVGPNDGKYRVQILHSGGASGAPTDEPLFGRTASFGLPEKVREGDFLLFGEPLKGEFGSDHDVRVYTKGFLLRVKKRE